MHREIPNEELVSKLHGSEKSKIFDSVERPGIARPFRADGGLPKRAGEEGRAQEGQKERFYAPMSFETSSDGLTPILVYHALGGKGCCILESAFEKGEGKKSLIGIQPIGTFQATGKKIQAQLPEGLKAYEADPYQALKEFSKDRKAFGFIGYDAVRLKEKIPNRHSSKAVPDFFFHIYKTIITFDHERETIHFSHEGTAQELDALIARCYSTSPLRPFSEAKEVPIQDEMSRKEFAELVERAKEYIRAGDIFQVVLSRTFKSKTHATPFEIYRALRQTSPAPYLFFFEEKDFALAGASPELLISVQDGEIESMPIAGTCPKGMVNLLADPKECAEHVMLVDLARNDVGAVSSAGSVRVAEFQTVKSFSHVDHIVSRVVGDLHPSFQPLDAFKASFPAGTLSGAPKIRAMQIIDELELSHRGLYGGAIAVLDERCNLTSCIAIRMAFIQGSDVEVRTGAGVVLDSIGEKEALETEHKARGVIEALKLAAGGVA